MDIRTLSAHNIAQIVDYDPETGFFLWKPRPIETFICSNDKRRAAICRIWNDRYAGTEAFTASSGGYRVGTIYKRMVKAHRVAWLLMTGQWPSGEIDHRDRNPSNNRWSNLRIATSGQNKANQGMRKSNTSGAKGVYFRRDTEKWSAKIRVGNGLQKSLGDFASKSEATSAYDRALIELHGEFASPNAALINGGGQ